MPTTFRWIIAIVLSLVELAAASIVVLGGAFSTVACIEVPPDWVYYLLVVEGLLLVVAAVASAVLVMRRSRAIVIAIPAGLGVFVLCVGLTAYYAILAQYC